MLLNAAMALRMYIYLAGVQIFIALMLPITNAAFDEVPDSQEVTVGSMAVFRCRHSTADIISWKVNGTFVGRNPPPNIILDIITEGVNLVDTLTIVASLEYNGTTIVCVAEFRDETPAESSEPPAVLRVQANASPITEAPTYNFITSPTSVITPVGSPAVFHCVHSNADQLGWEIGRRALRDLPPDLVNESRNGNNNSTLTITALLKYNSSLIECIAILLDKPSERSAAVLSVQGALNAVKNLTRGNSSITWEAPFSLDLTNSNPDIIYCVDIYNITCGRRVLVRSDCHVTDTNYTALSDGYLYEYIVTPRSNVEGAVNGTPSQPLRDDLPLILFSSSKLSVRQNHSLLRDLEVNLTYSRGHSLPPSYALSLQPLDGLNGLDHVGTTSTVVEESNTLKLGGDGLEAQRLWNGSVLAYGCDEHRILLGELSTHDFQAISVSSPSAGNVRVTGIFIEGSTATGVLVIVSGDNGVHHHIATRDSSDIILEVTITGVAGGEYTVSVFVVEETGLPFERAAMLPKPLLVEGGNVEHPSPTIEYSLESTSSGVCVKCNFQDRETSNCVAVAHRKSDLMNILSQKLTRSGDTASGCIEGVNLKDYQVGVVGGKLLESGPARSVDSTAVIVIAVVVSVVVVLTVIVSILSVIAIVSYRKRHSRFELEERMHRPNHYAPAPPTENPQAPLVVQRSEGDETYATPANAAIQASAASDSTEMVTLYSTIADKPQPESVSPADDGRIVYSEVVKTKGVNDKLYAVVKVKEGITVSKPDDLTKVVYSKISPSGIQRSSPALQTDNLPTTPVPTPFTADSVFSALLPVASKWLDIGEAFPLSEKRLDDIDTTEGDKECLRQMIEVYMMRVDLHHTWDEIVNVLKRIEEGNLADKIFSVHVAPYVMTLPNQPQVPERHSLGKVDTALDLEQQDPTSEDNLVPSTHSHTVETGQSTPANSEDDYVCNAQLPTSKDESSRADAAVLEMPSDSEESTEKNAGPGSRVDNDGDSEVSESSVTLDKASLSLIDDLLPMASKWKDIGVALSLDEDILQEIFIKNNTPEECLREMLKRYLVRTDVELSREEIDKALRSINNEQETVHDSEVDSSTEVAEEISTGISDTLTDSGCVTASYESPNPLMTSTPISADVPVALPTTPKRPPTSHSPRHVLPSATCSALIQAEGIAKASKEFPLGASEMTINGTDGQPLLVEEADKELVIEQPRSLTTREPPMNAKMESRGKDEVCLQPSKKDESKSQSPDSAYLTGYTEADSFSLENSDCRHEKIHLQENVCAKPGCSLPLQAKQGKDEVCLQASKKGVKLKDESKPQPPDSAYLTEYTEADSFPLENSDCRHEKSHLQENVYGKPGCSLPLQGTDGQPLLVEGADKELVREQPRPFHKYISPQL